jgi:glycosyltransferase involved in cell wall biosynthesis
MQRSSISLASYDTFHIPMLQRGLSDEYKTELISTWSLKRSAPNPNLECRNIWLMHYALQLYKMFPVLQLNNQTYSALVAAFDAVLCQILNPAEADAYIPLSGVALWSGRKFRKAGKPVILECGSTHTDHQHEVVFAEYQRNGIKTSLFPESYRDRVRQEFVESEAIFLPTRFVAKTFIERGIPESKIYLNPYGADTSRFRPREEEDLERPFRVICPSGVNLRKGARVLVEAWRKLGWQDAELHWIGQPNAQSEHLFKPMPAGITWHGWMPHEELAKLYAGCDVLVLPSFEEGFAKVLVESAASGLALMATPETGVEEFFTPDNPEGWLVPSNSVEALCEALIEAKTNRQRTREVGLRAATRAQNGFSIADYGRRANHNLRKILAS